MCPAEGDFVLAVVHEWKRYDRPALRQAIPVCDKNGVPCMPSEFENNGRIFITYGEDLQTGDVIWGSLKQSETFGEKSYSTDSRWIFSGQNIEPLEEHRFCEILDADRLPNNDAKELRYPGFMPRPIFFLRVGNYVYGPYRHDARYSHDLEFIKFSPVRYGVYCRIPFDEIKRVLGSHYIESPEQDAFYARRKFVLNMFELEEFLQDPELQHCAMGSEELAEWFLGFFDPPHEVGAAIHTLLNSPLISSSGIVEERLSKLSGKVLALQEFHDWRVTMVDRFLRDSQEGEELLNSRLSRAETEYVERNKSKLEERISKQLMHLQLELEKSTALRDSLVLETQKLTQRRIEQEEQIQADLSELAALEEVAKHNLAKSVTELKANVLEIGPIVELFLGQENRVPPSSEVAQSGEPSDEEVYGLTPYVGSYHALQRDKERAYVERLQEDLASSGRYLEYQQVANIWVCVKTGYLTILAGPPGVGKSSLVTLLADTINLGERAKVIPVERNWSDDRDLLGYVNALHNRYEASNSGFLEHLIRAEKDARESAGGLYWILLDEMNLGPIEHYFAKFISAMAHYDVRKRVITLYQQGVQLSNSSVYPNQVSIGGNVHFFGTINTDFSTEPLSPRLLDRANVVWVEAGKPRPGTPVFATNPAKSGETVNYRDVYENCIVVPSADKEKWVYGRLERVYDLCADGSYGSRHVISPRTYNEITNYVANSDGLMPPEVAFDFQILQRILPRLGGYGEDCRRRLEEFQRYCTEMEAERSARRVEQILVAGKIDDNYDFLR
jgi:energy-coupling factor transporter ATP-binding protein EcfA2